MRIGIASADSRAISFATLLEQRDIQTELSLDLGDVSDLVNSYDFDMLLIDSAVAAGGSAIADLRRLHKTVPIMVVGSDMTVQQSIEYYASGVDDVITWLPDVDIVVARIRAMVRRYRGADPSVYAIGPLRFDMIRRSLSHDDEPVALTSKEYEVLEAMVLRKGAILTKDVLLDQLYGRREAPNTRTIDVFVCNLRKKLAACGAQDVIETVRGLGYSIKPTRALIDARADRPQSPVRPDDGKDAKPKTRADAAHAA